MLTRFEVKGFKSLVDVAVDLGAVNVFIGANGSGKSNLLEAIGFLGATAASGPGLETFRYRGLRLGSPSSYLACLAGHRAASIALAASGADSEYRATVSAQPGRPSAWSVDRELVEIAGKVIAERDGTRGRLRPIDSEIGIATPLRPDRSIKPATLGLARPLAVPVGVPTATMVGAESLEADPTAAIDLLEDYAIYAPSTPRLRGFLDDVQRDPLGLGGSQLGRAIEEMLADDSEKLGPFDMDEVLNLIEWADHIGTNAAEIGSPEEAPIRLRIGDRFMGNDHKTVSAAEASEGALHVLFLLALAGHEQSPGMFAVDNFAQTLHPRLARALTEMICDQILANGTRQMFATTHNPLSSRPEFFDTLRVELPAV